MNNRVIEAALFMSPNPLSIQRLMEILGSTDYSAIKSQVFETMEDFNALDLGLEIVQHLDSFQMRVRPEVNAAVAQLGSGPLFNEGIMKTLALIAFKQPIFQSTVIKYRNNAAYDHIHLLIENGFISREAKGRTFVLKTTQKFFETFGKDAFLQKEGASNPSQ